MLTNNIIIILIY